MLCESLSSMLLLFKFLFKSTSLKKKKKKEKNKEERRRSPWTRKFSGRGDETPICSSEQGKLVQIEDEVKALDKTKRFCPRPTQGRINVLYVQPMDEEAQTYKLIKIPKQSNIWMSKRC